jgi:hypothetical protein
MWPLCSLQTVVSPWGRHNAATAVPSGQNPANLGPMVYITLPVKEPKELSKELPSDNQQRPRRHAKQQSPTKEQEAAAKRMAQLMNVAWDEAARKTAVDEFIQVCSRRAFL